MTTVTEISRSTGIIHELTTTIRTLIDFPFLVIQQGQAGDEYSFHGTFLATPGILAAGNAQPSGTMGAVLV